MFEKRVVRAQMVCFLGRIPCCSHRAVVLVLVRVVKLGRGSGQGCGSRCIVCCVQNRMKGTTKGQTGIQIVSSLGSTGTYTAAKQNNGFNHMLSAYSSKLIAFVCCLISWCLFQAASSVGRVCISTFLLAFMRHRCGCKHHQALKANSRTE